MSTLTESARAHTALERDQIAHLNRLVSEWGMLADFCFSDLLLYTRTHDDRWLTIGQVRPVTGQTIFTTDFVGTAANETEVPVLEQCSSLGVPVEADVRVEELADESRMLAIPVRHEGQIIAVLTKEWIEQTGRRPGELERVYTTIFDHFVEMIAAGAFPSASRVGDSSSAPRVGDGVMYLDGDACVQYVSPNATSALHRVGIQTGPVGMRLSELGFHDGPVRQAFERAVPVIEEFEQGTDTTLLCRCVPFVEGGSVSGAVLLVRDVTELRRRDRLLLSKDATIREIHHRVKNNLQTISSLLRLQSRRLTHPEAVAAVGESVRRIRTIALVHEALSREPGDDVTFLEIVRPLVRLAEEGLQSPDRPVRFTVMGDGGRIPARIATPLSVVLTELLQNAVEHAFGDGGAGGDVVVNLSHDDQLAIRVVDNGRGVATGFDLEQATGLGLSIVRTLVTTELAGAISIEPATADDLTSVGLSCDGPQRGTVVSLSVPILDED
ncbi:sensor histidine kinase [Ilumatobacteraceae bacterium]|nr:sensor histidine kinase [Ilumatobacteraceae bacterium]